MSESKRFKHKVKERSENWTEREDTIFTVKATHSPGTLPYVLVEEIERLNGEIERKELKYQIDNEAQRITLEWQKDEIKRLTTEGGELRAKVETLSRALFEMSELVPNKEFWACPVCAHVNPSTKKQCWNGCGQEDSTSGTRA